MTEKKQSCGEILDQSLALKSNPSHKFYNMHSHMHCHWYVEECEKTAQSITTHTTSTCAIKPTTNLNSILHNMYTTIVNIGYWNRLSGSKWTA